MRLTDRISTELIRFARGGGREILIPNYYLGFWEMDLFRLMPSGLTVEYEIKVSRSDFKADFKKGFINGAFGNKPTLKHDRLLRGLGPNRFFFVVPMGMINQHECPDYAGLIEVKPSNENQRVWMVVTKNAPLLHRRKIYETKPDIYQQLAESLSFREMHLREKLMKTKKLSKEIITNES